MAGSIMPLKGMACQDLYKAVFLQSCVVAGTNCLAFGFLGGLILTRLTIEHLHSTFCHSVFLLCYLLTYYDFTVDNFNVFQDLCQGCF